MTTDPTAPTTDERTPPRAGRPPLDVASLVGGVVVAALTAVLAFGDLHDLGVSGRVVWPIVLLGVGVAVLASARR